MWGNWQLGYMQLGQYTQKHNRVASAMRKVDGVLVLVASGDLNTKATLGDGATRREVSWSEGMLEECAGAMDLISEHFYKGNTPWGEKRPEDVAVASGALREEIRKKAEAHRELQKRLGLLPKRSIPIAMDEWNYWHNKYVYGELGCQYDLTDALGVAVGLHEYFRNSDIIHMAHYAQTVNVIGCIKTTKTDAFFDTTALPLLLYRREFGKVPLSVSGNHVESSLDVVAARTEDGKAATIGIVNPSGDEKKVQLDLAGANFSENAHVWRIAGGDPNLFNTADKQPVTISEEKDTPFKGQASVPPYSVNLYRVSLE
jgi:alpha-N-arabinofuranosidase